MHVAPLLQRFVDDELARAPMLIEQARVAAAAQLNRAGAADGLGPNEVQTRRAAAQALQQRGSALDTQYVQALRRLVAADLATDSRTGNASHGSIGGIDQLALMDESQVESDIEISRATMLIESVVEWEQRELQTFTSALRGETHVGADSNPIRPALVARALWQATDALATPPAQRVQAFRAAAEAIASPLKQAFAAACSRIEAQGVEPSQYRTVMLAPGSVADTGSAARQARADTVRPGALHALLAALSGNASTARDAAASAPIDLEHALSRLDALMQRGDEGGASHHRPAGPAYAPRAADRHLIELMSRLFDAVLADPALPAPAKAAIARLQLSALRIAVRDPTLLDTYSHPTWRLVDRIASACRHAAVVGSARVAALAKDCEDLADELAASPAPDAALYRQALARLDALVAEDLRQAQLAAHGAIAALQRTERRMRIQGQVQARLEEQLVRCPVGPATRRFLLREWAHLVAEAILHSGPDSESTAALTRTVDDLLWSLHPPAHSASRQRLVKMLPGLLARLRAGMAQRGVAAGEQQAMLAELEASHSETLWPGSTATATLADEAAETPEEIVRRLREEVIEELPARHDFGNSVLDVTTLDTAPAELMPDDFEVNQAAERARRSPAAVAALQAGGAARLLLQGRWNSAQLLWRSEGGELLLFADSAGLTHALTRRALERLHAEGLASFDEPESLTQRAVASLLASLPGVNPPRA